MRKQWLVLLVAILACFTLWGCGSGGSSGGSDVTNSDTAVEDAAGNEVVGAAACIDCHDAISWSKEAVEGFLAGKHVIHSSHITAASGDCLTCHDPFGDGADLEA